MPEITKYSHDYMVNELGYEFTENEHGIFYDFEAHAHQLWVTTEMVNKYNLQEVAVELDQDEVSDYFKINSEDEHSNYTHYVFIDDVISYRKSKDDPEATTLTPWGEVWSSSFEAFFNEFPVELFNESEELVLYLQV